MTEEKKKESSKILIIDNDAGTTKSLKNLLEPHQAVVMTANDWETALYLFNQNRFDLCILDTHIGDMPASSLIQKWREHEIEGKRTTPFAMASGKGLSAAQQNLNNELGEIQNLAKPFKVPQLLVAMQKAESSRKSQETLAEVTKKIDNFLHIGKPDKALKIGKETLLSLGEKGVLTYAKLLVDTESFSDAKELLQKLVLKDQSNMSYLNLLAKVHLKEGNFEQAQKYYEIADKTAPNNFDRVNDMIKLYLDLKLPKESIEKMQQMIDLNPDKPDMKFGFYQLLDEAGFADLARDFCAQTSTPLELIKYFNNKGVIFSKQNEFEKAISEYQRAVRLIPNSKELYRILYNIAIAHINLKKPENLKEAQAILKKCLEIKPDYDKAKEKLDMLKAV